MVMHDLDVKSTLYRVKVLSIILVKFCTKYGSRFTHPAIQLVDQPPRPPLLNVDIDFPAKRSLSSAKVQNSIVEREKQ